MTVNTPFDGVVVTNPYNYYIYFPDAQQWVPPRWFNFVFQWAPSPLGTVRWDTTKDPYGNTQFQNENQPATFICSNTLSDYTGGGAFNVPPSTNPYAAALEQLGATSGSNYFAAINLGASPSPIPVEASIYQITVSIAFQFTATAAASFGLISSLGLSSGSSPPAPFVPNILQLVPVLANVPVGNTSAGPFIISSTLPVPIPVYSLGGSPIESIVVTVDGNWPSSVAVDVYALANIVAG